MLVIDYDEPFLDSLRAEQKSDGPSVITASSLRDAQKKIASRSTPIIGIFINPSIGSPAWIALARAAGMYQKQAPVFLVLDQLSSLYDSDMDEMQLAGPVGKPCTYADLISEMNAHSGREKTSPIRRSHQVAIQYERIAQGLLSNSGASLDAKLDGNFSLGRQLLSVLAVEGLTADNVQFAIKFVENTQKIVQEIATSKSAQKNGVSEILMRLPSHEHGLLTTLVGGILQLQIGITDPVMFTEIGMGCLLHDVSLIPHGEVLQRENQAAMTAKDLEIFRKHPAASAAILTQIGSIKQVVIDAVAQHHLQRHTNRLAELIALSDEAAHLLSLNANAPGFRLLDQARARFLPNYSKPIVGAFEACLSG